MAFRFSGPPSMTLPLTLSADPELLLASDDTRLEAVHGIVEVHMPPRSAAVWLLRHEDR